MKYFFIMKGLGGCYMPDSADVVAVSTRRELKAILESDASDMRDAGCIGLSKRAIAWLANAAWGGNWSHIDYGFKYQSPNRPFQIECAPTDREAYLTFIDEES